MALVADGKSQIAHFQKKRKWRRFQILDRSQASVGSVTAQTPEDLLYAEIYPTWACPAFAKRPGHAWACRASISSSHARSAGTVARVGHTHQAQADRTWDLMGMEENFSLCCGIHFSSVMSLKAESFWEACSSKSESKTLDLVNLSLSLSLSLSPSPSPSPSLSPALFQCTYTYQYAHRLHNRSYHYCTNDHAMRTLMHLYYSRIVWTFSLTARKCALSLLDRRGREGLKPTCLHNCHFYVVCFVQLLASCRLLPSMCCHGDCPDSCQSRSITT